MIKEKPTKIGTRYLYKPFNKVVEIVMMPNTPDYLSGTYNGKYLPDAKYSNCFWAGKYLPDAKYSNCFWAFTTFGDWLELKGQDAPQ